jgi:hypothetical protein
MPHVRRKSKKRLADLTAANELLAEQLAKRYERGEDI